MLLKSDEVFETLHEQCNQGMGLGLGVVYTEAYIDSISGDFAADRFEAPDFRPRKDRTLGSGKHWKTTKNNLNSGYTGGEDNQQPFVNSNFFSS